MTSSSLTLALVAVALAAGPVAADGVRHVPPAEAEAGAPIELVASIADAGHKDVVLHYRARGAVAWVDVAFTQAAGGQ